MPVIYLYNIRKWASFIWPERSAWYLDWAGRCQSNETKAALRPAAAKSAGPARRI